MPFLAFTGAVVCSSKKIGEPYFCYYRLLPQVARTYLCTRNLSDSPFLEKGGLRPMHPTCMQVAPSRGNPRSTAVRFRRGVHGVSKNAALLSGLSSVTPQGCVVGCYPAVCSFRTITSILRRWERRGKTLQMQFSPIVTMTPRRLESRFSSCYRLLPQALADVP